MLMCICVLYHNLKGRMLVCEFFHVLFNEYENKLFVHKKHEFSFFIDLYYSIKLPLGVMMFGNINLLS